MSWAKGGSSSPSSLCRHLLRALVNSPPRTMPTPGLHSPQRSADRHRGPC